MAISIKGVNTGVIRKSNNFIALALKIKEPRNKESLFFMSVMELRDLLIALESRMHQKHKLDAAARLQYEQARDKVIKKMAENIPEILVDELKNADINRRVNTLELTDNQGENLTFVLTLHDGSKCELVVNELQIEMLARAIIHAINNAEMRELALRITSLLDFLPLYDVDCQENGNLEYDTYSQPEWKHNLFDHYLAVLYRFKDESGKEQFSGAVVKTREATPGKEIEAITRRMLDFSPRLKKLAGVPCQVYVRTEAAKETQPEAYIVGEHFGDARQWLQADVEDAAMNYRGFTFPLWGFLANTDISYDPQQIDAQTCMAWMDNYRAGLSHQQQLRMFNQLDSHDTARFKTLLGRDIARLPLAVVWLFTWPGVPCIYYGDEVGLDGKNDPFCRKPFPWQVEKQDTALFALYQRMIALRKKSQALRHGGCQVLYAEDNVVVFVRVLNQQRVLVAINRGEACEVVLPASPLLNAVQWQCKEGHGQLTDGILALPAISATVWMN